jgi:hypothetical protein
MITLNQLKYFKRKLSRDGFKTTRIYNKEEFHVWLFNNCSVGIKITPQSKKDILYSLPLEIVNYNMLRKYLFEAYKQNYGIIYLKGK